MPSDFDSFSQSGFDAFHQSPLNARGPSGRIVIGGSFTHTGGGNARGKIAVIEDGTWAALQTSTGFGGTVSAVREFQGKLYAGGDFTTVDGDATIKYLARWTGTAWEKVITTTDFDSLIDSLEVHGGKLYIGGAFTSVDGVSSRGIVSYDGETFGALSGLSAGARVLGSTTFKSNVVANGIFDIGGGAGVNVAQYNGASWSNVDGGNGAGGLNTQDSYVDGSTLYVGGGFICIGYTNPGTCTGGTGITTKGIASTGGSSWSALGSGIQGLFFPAVVDMLKHGSDLIAVGGFTTAGGVANTLNIAAWSGSTWSALSTGLNSFGNGLVEEPDTGELLACGAFTTAGGNAADRVASWDGSAWAEYGDGVDNGTVFSITVADV